MKGVAMLRRLVASRPSIVSRTSSSSSSSLMETLMISSAAATASYSTLILSDDLRKPLHFQSASKFSADFSSSLPTINHRNFSSDSASGQSKMVLIETEKELNDSLAKAQDHSVPSIFYFTAAWCGPCKFISPIIGQLSEKYPHVTTYKVDIDKEDLAGALTKLNISAVPTVYFFKDGKKASAVVGADANQLSATMEELYK